MILDNNLKIIKKGRIRGLHNVSCQEEKNTKANLQEKLVR